LGLDTNNKGGTLASSNDLMGVVDGLDEQTVGALELVDDGLGEIDKANGGVLVVQVLCELRNTLSVGLRLELEALSAQQSLQLLVVSDDTIVYDSELPVGVRSVSLVRLDRSFVSFVGPFREKHAERGSKEGDLPVGMAVQPGRRAVSSPSCVGDTGM
jgi:hypothetical protein